MDGIYKFRSAITNPTRKNIFMAGVKGIATKHNDIVTTLKIEKEIKLK